MRTLAVVVGVAVVAGVMLGWWRWRERVRRRERLDAAMAEAARRIGVATVVIGAEFLPALRRLATVSSAMIAWHYGTTVRRPESFARIDRGTGS